MFFDSVPLRAPALSILCCLREDNLLDLPVIATFKALCIKTWVLPCNVADHTQKIYFYCCSLRTVLHWNFGLSGLVWMETLLSVMVVKFELFSSKIASIMEEGPWQHGPTNRAFSLMAQLERRWLQAENSTNSCCRTAKVQVQLAPERKASAVCLHALWMKDVYIWHLWTWSINLGKGTRKHQHFKY